MGPADSAGCYTIVDAAGLERSVNVRELLERVVGVEMLHQLIAVSDVDAPDGTGMLVPSDRAKEKFSGA